MKIAFVVNSLSNGGAERTISNITTHLPEGYDVDIIVNDDSAPTYPVNSRMVSLGLKPCANKLNLPYQLQLFFRRVSALRKLKRENKYKVVFSFSESASIANILSGKKYTKICLSIRTHLSHYADVPLYRIFGFPAIKLLYKRADAIVAVSQGVKDDLIEKFGIPEQLIHVITNGCDAKLISKLASYTLTTDEEDVMSGENVIVTAGRLVREKGQWHLIKAVKYLKEKGINCKLVIIGDGTMRESLQKTAHECDLDKEVIFTGFETNPFKLMARADVFVFPSITEGMGNGLIEALACGIPCISTDHESGAREILAPDTDVRYRNTTNIEHAEYGLLIPVCRDDRQSGDDITPEEQMMAEAIELILENSELRQHYIDKALERASQMTVDDAAVKWMELMVTL